MEHASPVGKESYQLTQQSRKQLDETLTQLATHVDEWNDSVSHVAQQQAGISTAVSSYQSHMNQVS